MRKYICGLIPALALSAILFSSCQKELTLENSLPSTGNPPAVTGDFRAKVNGVQFIANQAASASRVGGILNITGLATDGKLITITLFDSGVHNYILNQASLGAIAYAENQNASTAAFTSNSSDEPARAGGSCRVTSIDTVNKKISGTFSVKVFRHTDSTTKDITEGTFNNITYTTTIGVPPTAATDTFRVKLDGVDWNNYSVSGVLVPGMNILAITSNYNAAGSKNIGLSIPKTITPGSYTFDDLNYDGVYNPTTGITNINPYVASGGNLTILEHNTATKRIRGTFNFVGTCSLIPGPPISFTQGYFSLTYQ